MWIDLPACRTSDAPTVAVWGDSYAMHWLAGLDGLAVIQMTKSACAPVEGLAHASDRYTPAWSRECVAFNDSVLNAIEAMPSVRYVLISSPFGQVMVDDGQGLFFDGAVHPFSDVGEAAFARGLERLKAAGKIPIILSPTPHAPFDAGRCNERMMEGKAIMGRSGCDIPLEAAQFEGRGIGSLIEEIGAKNGVKVLSPSAVLCDDQVCRTREGGQILYIDNGHLTREGARIVVRGLGLRETLTQ